MIGLAIVGGVLVGLALGLTGGGGGVFAVPILVHGLALQPREAVGVSLAAVGATALVGSIGRLRRGETAIKTGLLFALAGVVGAPIGSWLSKQLPESVLLVLFGCLMVFIAARMWRQASGPRDRAAGSTPFACHLDASGRPKLGPRCVAFLSLLGLLTGILSGLFGVGGGFVIVPALVLFGGMAFPMAVATSLLVIFLISLSGVGSYWMGGGQLSLAVTGQFVLGGVVGMQLGSRASRRISGPTLQRVFAVVILAVACFVILKAIA